ncbi:BCCT family transporter [Brevibacterium sp. 5221]|uniref:BCCT family transporter n=1 Tax=Brevibacterium rongguiense TaxID=2695267 RepID=A0A6N9HBJ7_9MICO|nr:BCCT family transporter [Brevibacterium rongguiense]MYM20932.1 BCCT family transporter [Brevibacterium rongguiense]
MTQGREPSSSPADPQPAGAHAAPGSTAFDAPAPGEAPTAFSDAPSTAVDPREEPTAASLEERLGHADRYDFVDPLDPDRREVEPIDDSGSDDEITEQLRGQGVKIGRGGVTPAVFYPAIGIVVLVTALAMVFPDGTGAVLESIQGWIVRDLGWFYMLTIGILIGFAVFFGVSKYGRIRLGRDGEKPEFGLLSWFAMLFAAGMGIGLVFFGVAEPLTYMTSDPKPGTDGPPSALAEQGLAQTFIHWGLHPWACYAIIGLALAYGIHRRGRPVSIRWALEPLFGERIKGWLGDTVDVIAVLGTLFGVATSLGLGVQQIAAGVQSIGIISEVNNTILVVLVVIITLLATTSVVTGLGAGIKWLSNINLSVAGLLLISLIIMGPTVFLFREMIQAFGLYLANFFQMTFDTAAYTGEEGQTWASSWTIFYWGWWISWAPFVGVFIARISRGRTIREFIAGVLLVPTMVSFVWFSVLGGIAIHRQLTQGDLWHEGGEAIVPEKALFTVLSDLPAGPVLSVVAILLVAIFFITSSDSGSLVVDMLSSGGHPNPPLWSRVVWAFLEGLVAIALLLSNGLTSLQAGSLITALPFSVILLLMAFATLKTLKLDHAMVEEQKLLHRAEAISEHITDSMADRVTGHVNEQFAGEWGEVLDDRIDYRISRTRAGRVDAGRGRTATGEQPAVADPDAARKRGGKPPRKG